MPQPWRREPNVVCLLTARNCEADLQGWFESVERVADAVVALDGKSTDNTRALLESHPLVATVLTNPASDEYPTWHEGRTRNRLLNAAGEMRPSWILTLDADERIPPDDADALRAFLVNGGDRQWLYLMCVHRMIDDLEHFDRNNVWVGRLFPYEKGQAFPDVRLHGAPLPLSTRDRWRKTTVRIQHLAGITEERRRARYDKYRQLDPNNEFQADYSRLLDAPERVKRWQDRPPCLPVIVNGAWTDEAAEFDAMARAGEDHPVLSAIVISRNDEARIERAVRSVVTQECPAPFEVIVVISGSDRTAEIVRQRFPQVRVIELADPGLPGAARNAGLAVARGRYISFPGSHVELPPGSLAARVEAHRLGYAMVTGTTLNGTNTVAGWASYFLDHGPVLPERPSEELTEAPYHCSYLRQALLAVGPFPEHMRAGEDTVVNNELFRRGYGAVRARDVRLIHHTPCRTPWKLVRHHFRRGRAYGTMLLQEERPGKPLITRPFLRSILFRYPLRRVRRARRCARRWGANGLIWRWRFALPLVVVASISAWLGVWYEILLPGRGKFTRLFAGRLTFRR
jgi:glycosyltransferase involved in cell wall biosynthesis